MKKAVTIVTIAGVAMASGIEGVEDHSFHHISNVGGILPTIRERTAIAHDDFADDHFAVQDLADDTLFSLFKKKKHPQQPQPQTKPTNPDDVVDFEPIHVDLNSNEFFAEELGNDEFSMLSSLFHKKKKPQHNPDEFKPREIPSNEFFADEEMWSRTDLPLHPVNKDRDVIKPRYKIIAHDRVEYDDELFAAEDLGDDNFGLLSIFKKKKKPQQQEQPSQPKEIPSNEFFAEELGNDEFSMLSSLFHKKKKPQHNPEEFKPREIPSNEFFAADDIADDNFSGMLWFKPKKDQKEQKEKKHHHHPEKPAQDKPVPVPVPKPNVNATNNATSNELFSLKDIFHHKKKPQQPQQPQGPVEIPSNEFFAENLGDDEYSVFSNLFHKKKHPQHPQPQTKPTNPDDIVDFEPIHVDLNSNEFFAEELGNDEFSMLSSLFHKKKKPQHNPDEFKPREIPSNEFFSLKDLFHHKKKPQQPQQPQGPVEIPSNEFFADEIADDTLFLGIPVFEKPEKTGDMFGPKKYGLFGPRKSGLNLDELADGEFARMGGPQISLIKHDKERTKKPVEKAIAADEFGDDELVSIPPQMGQGRSSYHPQIRGASLQHLGRLLREAN